MSKLQSVPTTDSLIAKADAINGIWGIAKALEEELVHGNNPNLTAQCLSIALVNLATQLTDSL